MNPIWIFWNIETLSPNSSPRRCDSKWVASTAKLFSRAVTQTWLFSTVKTRAWVRNFTDFHRKNWRKDDHKMRKYGKDIVCPMTGVTTMNPNSIYLNKALTKYTYNISIIIQVYVFVFLGDRLKPTRDRQTCLCKKPWQNCQSDSLGTARQPLPMCLSPFGVGTLEPPSRCVESQWVTWSFLFTRIALPKFSYPGFAWAKKCSMSRSSAKDSRVSSRLISFQISHIYAFHFIQTNNVSF